MNVGSSQVLQEHLQQGLKNPNEVAQERLAKHRLLVQRATVRKIESFTNMSPDVAAKMFSVYGKLEFKVKVADLGDQLESVIKELQDKGYQIAYTEKKDFFIISTEMPQ